MSAFVVSLGGCRDGGSWRRNCQKSLWSLLLYCEGESVSVMEQNILELRLRTVPGTWGALCYCSPCFPHPAVLVLLGASLSRRGSRLCVFSSPRLAAGKWQSWDSSSVCSDTWTYSGNLCLILFHVYLFFSSKSLLKKKKKGGSWIWLTCQFCQSLEFT